MSNEEDLLDSLNCCIEKVNEKIQELSKSMLLEGQKLEIAKETVGDLISHIHQLTDATCFLYGQIENMEHRNKCNEKFKNLGYDPSWKHTHKKGESNDLGTLENPLPVQKYETGTTYLSKEEEKKND